MTSKKLARRTSTPGLSRERADSIAGGALVAQTAMDVLGADEMVVSGQGMREGAVYESLGIEPPPGEEVREASARALVSRFASWDEGRARRRADIALRVLGSVDPAGTAKARERLEQAAFVLDVGRSIDYYRRFEHTADILLTSDLAGFTHRKLALLAAVVRFAGDEGVSIRMYRPLLTAEDRPQVARLATILAFADDIEHRVPAGGEIPVTCEERRRTVVLTAPVFDPSRRLAMEQRFRRAFGRRLVVQPSEGDEGRE
jgi:exopolyphosphatase/guanosine-5'-triphosphate,3'-diphosphate pyrophosphatase